MVVVVVVVSLQILEQKAMSRVCMLICLMFIGVAEGMSAKGGSPKPMQKKKEELVRRRSSDGFTMLLHCQSRLEKLYNQTLRTQVQS